MLGLMECGQQVCSVAVYLVGGVVSSVAAYLVGGVVSVGVDGLYHHAGDVVSVGVDGVWSVGVFSGRFTL